MGTGSFDCELVDGAVWLRMHGVIDAETGDTIMTKAIEMASGNQFGKLLFDVRDADLAESMANLYGRPDQAETMGFSRAHKSAMLCAERNDKTDFLEMVSRNRGFQFRVFDDEAECLAWLNA